MGAVITWASYLCLNPRDIFTCIVGFVFHGGMFAGYVLHTMNWIVNIPSALITAFFSLHFIKMLLFELSSQKISLPNWRLLSWWLSDADRTQPDVSDICFNYVRLLLKKPTHYESTKISVKRLPTLKDSLKDIRAAFSPSYMMYRLKQGEIVRLISVRMVQVASCCLCILFNILVQGGININVSYLYYRNLIESFDEVCQSVVPISVANIDHIFVWMCFGMLLATIFSVVNIILLPHMHQVRLASLSVRAQILSPAC